MYCSWRCHALAVLDVSSVSGGNTSEESVNGAPQMTSLFGVRILFLYLSLSLCHSFSCLVWFVFHALFHYYSLSIVPSIVQSSQSTAHQRNKHCFGSYAVRYHLGVRSTDNAVSTFIHVHVPTCTAARVCPRVYSISSSSFLFIVTSENAYWMYGSADGAREAKCAWVQRLAPSKELATHQAQQ